MLNNVSTAHINNVCTNMLSHVIAIGVVLSMFCYFRIPTIEIYMPLRCLTRRCFFSCTIIREHPRMYLTYSYILYSSTVSFSRVLTHIIAICLISCCYYSFIIQMELFRLTRLCVVCSRVVYIRSKKNMAFSCKCVSL